MTNAELMINLAKMDSEAPVVATGSENVLVVRPRTVKAELRHDEKCNDDLAKFVLYESHC